MGYLEKAHVALCQSLATALAPPKPLTVNPKDSGVAGRVRPDPSSGAPTLKTWQAADRKADNSRFEGQSFACIWTFITITCHSNGTQARDLINLR